MESVSEDAKLLSFSPPPTTMSKSTAEQTAYAFVFTGLPSSVLTISRTRGAMALYECMTCSFMTDPEALPSGLALDLVALNLGHGHFL